jgi:serralysin
VVLIGLGGDDVLIGGAGNDVLIGGSGNNVLRGGPGDDRYIFNADQDVGNNIVDELPGVANGIDTLDFLRTTTTGITIDLSLTTQQTVAPGLQITLVSGDSIENVVGTHLDDTLTGNALDNEFIGGRGNDVIDGRAGTNTVRERRDADFYLASTSPTSATLTIISGAGSETKTLENIQIAHLTGGEGNNTLDASAFIGTVFLFGMGGNDVLIGGTGSSWLDGGDGHDVLYGGSGINVLIGGAGNDVLWAGEGSNFLLGGLGNDSYMFDLSRYAGSPGTVTIFENAGEGFADALFGLGPSGSLVNLFVPTQYFYRNTITNAIVSSTVALLDPEYELLLTLNLSSPGTVEFSFA